MPRGKGKAATTETSAEELYRRVRCAGLERHPRN